MHVYILYACGVYVCTLHGVCACVYLYYGGGGGVWCVYVCVVSQILQMLAHRVLR